MDNLSIETKKTVSQIETTIRKIIVEKLSLKNYIKQLERYEQRSKVA